MQTQARHEIWDIVSPHPAPMILFHIFVTLKSQHMKNLTILASLVLISTTSLAQPNFMGCHYFRNQGPKPQPLSAQQRASIEASIERSDTFDIVHYDLVLDVTDYSNQYLKGAATVSYSPKFDNLESILLDLYQLQVDSVKDESGMLNWNYDDECLRIYFSESPALEDTLGLTVYYQGEPYRDPYWGGFYYEAGYTYNLGIGLTTIPPNFGKVWYPCFDTFVERASYTYHVKSANGDKAHCQGTFIDEEVLEGDTVIRHYDFDMQIPTYLSAIAVCDYDEYTYDHEGANGTIPVSLKAKPNQLAGMMNIFVELGYAIDACEYWFGPYAWDRVGYVFTTDGALEIPTNIAYPQGMLNADLVSNGGLYTHELGHHWWGDIITLKTHNHMWIKEGPAEYSSHLFIEWKDGHEEFIATVKDNMLFVLEDAHVDDLGHHALSPIPDEEIYGRHTYYKGAAVLHNLRAYLGDDLFRETLTTMQSDYAYNSYTGEEFRDVLSEVSGYDLTSYFDDWIFQPGYATFVVDSFQVSDNGGTFETEVHVQQKLRAADHFHTNVPIDVTLIGANWETETMEQMVSDEFSSLTLDSDFEPVMVVLNGTNRLNQNRMDIEVTTYADDPFNMQLPWVDMRLIKNEGSDSALTRIEHVWSGADEENLDPGVWEVSNTHYWKVDGLWPEDAEYEARLNYLGADSTDLDYDLLLEGEVDFVLAYRETPEDPWKVYSDYTLNAGNLFNAFGSVVVDVLERGEYVFAMGDPASSIDDLATVQPSIQVFPNPADEQVALKAKVDGSHTWVISLFDINGRLVDQQSATPASGVINHRIETNELDAGSYIIHIADRYGRHAITEKLEIVH